MGLLVNNKLVPNNMALIPALRFCKCCVLVNITGENEKKKNSQWEWMINAYR